MAYQFLRASHVKNKTVLLRVDINESIDSKGKLADDFRLQAIVPTIHFLRNQGAKIIIASHAGRPEGKWDKKLSLAPMAARLAELLDMKYVTTDNKLPDYPLNHFVFFTGKLTDPLSLEALRSVPKKDIILVENLRFYGEEEANNLGFAKQLASIADVFVNDAFAVSHRKAASIAAITKYLPSYVGPLLEKEIKNLDRLLEKAKAPFVLMMGGIKISDKAKTLEHLGRKADYILIGGGLANLFFAAEGLEVGQSIVEEESRKLAWKIATNFKKKLVLPKDVVVHTNRGNGAVVRNKYEIKSSEAIYDIGPKTILEYANILKQAKTICWNGPLGYFEQKPFRTGTYSLARVIGGEGNGRSFVVAGGGETVEAIRQTHQQDNIDHLSTGGGAMLEYLAGNKLPGLEALK